LVAAWIALTLIGTATWTEILIIAVIGTAINYLLGDLVILPASGNTWASIVDGLVSVVLAYAVMEGMGKVTARDWWAILLFGVLVAGCEYFFHNYLKKSEEVAP